MTVILMMMMLMAMMMIIITIFMMIASGIRTYCILTTLLLRISLWLLLKLFMLLL